MNVLSGVLCSSKLDDQQSIEFKPCTFGDNFSCTAIVLSTLFVPFISSNVLDISLVCQNTKAVEVNILHQYLGHALAAVVHKILSLLN